MAVLTARARKRLAKNKSKNFAIPSKAPGSGSYPIHDIAHARAALSRVSQHGTPAEKAQVRRKVYTKYPGLKKRRRNA